MLHLEGFLDVYGTNNRGTDLLTQPQLLFDIGQLFGHGKHLYLGTEWYYAHNRKMTSSVVQAMVKWVW